MALGKWRFSSSRVQSASSSERSSGASTPTSTTTPTTTASTPSSGTGSRSLSSKKSSSSSSSNSSPQSLISSWLGKSSRRQAPKSNTTIKPSDPAYSRLHKPFTEQNLEHQRMLAAFEWNSQRPRRRDSACSWISSVSPCASPRSASIDYRRGD